MTFLYIQANKKAYLRRDITVSQHLYDIF